MKSYLREALDPSEQMTKGERVFCVAWAILIGPIAHLGEVINPKGDEGSLDQDHFYHD